MSSIEGLITNPANVKAHKISFHRRNDSDELDVFEAARYFSGYNEAAPPPKTIKEERPTWRGGRLSLDMPIRTNLLHRHDDVDHKPTTKEKIVKYKQPSSPGGKLASFLNSLFNQSSSKKKKPKPLPATKLEEESSPGGTRRIRRSSISHFRSASTTTTSDAKSTYSSSRFGFRSPPSYVAQITTAKISQKDWTINHSDHKLALTDLIKHNVTSHANSQVSEIYKRNSDTDSDLSSDLFELENYDLPVYETTKVDSIKNIRVATIANAS